MDTLKDLLQESTLAEDNRGQDRLNYQAGDRIYDAYDRLDVVFEKNKKILLAAGLKGEVAALQKLLGQFEDELSNFLPGLQMAANGEDM